MAGQLLVQLRWGAVVVVRWDLLASARKCLPIERQPGLRWGLYGRRSLEDHRRLEANRLEVCQYLKRPTQVSIKVAPCSCLGQRQPAADFL
jgi:hypothetical protein